MARRGPDETKTPMVSIRERVAQSSLKTWALTEITPRCPPNRNRVPKIKKTQARVESGKTSMRLYFQSPHHFDNRKLSLLQHTFLSAAALELIPGLRSPRFDARLRTQILYRSLAPHERERDA